MEILQEIVAADASLQMWFDRGLDFGHGSLVDAQLGNLPRVITSRSLDRQTTDSRLMSKREVKIAAVEWAISALLAVEPVDKEERKEQASAKLREFIQSPFWSKFKCDLGCTVCSQRLYKLLKNNRSVEVIKACNTKAVYTLVTHLLLGVFKSLNLIRVILTLLLSGSRQQ